MTRLRSYLLVAGQFAAGTYFVVMTPWTALPTLALLPMAAGILLGVWAVAAMGLARLHVLPEVAENTALVTHGPYRWIRHPMYSALLTGSLGCLIAQPRRDMVLVYLAVTAVLVIKLTHEERLLHERFPEYADYTRRTKRLIPRVY